MKNDSSMAMKLETDSVRTPLRFLATSSKHHNTDSASD